MGDFKYKIDIYAVKSFAGNFRHGLTRIYTDYLGNDERRCESGFQFL